MVPNAGALLAFFCVSVCVVAGGEALERDLGADDPYGGESGPPDNDLGGDDWGGADADGGMGDAGGGEGASGFGDLLGDFFGSN